jgi:hypothetical protein
MPSCLDVLEKAAHARAARFTAAPYSTLVLILWAKKDISPEKSPAFWVNVFQAQLGLPIPGTSNRAGLRIFFDKQELTIYEDEAGNSELLEWFDSRT